MTAAYRWCLVGLGVAVLLALPTVVRVLPVQDSAVSAAALLQRVQASGEVAYSGYAESDGGLQLPVTDSFSDLATLLGERSRLRVWWRGGDDWRVDSLATTGETDLIRSGAALTTWQYEANRVTTSVDPPVRLPRSSDLVPAVLGRRLLSEATPQEVSRLPAEQVAGRDAPGLRLTPSDPQSTVARVDVWVDDATGVALKVALYGADSADPAVSSAFLDFSTAPPPAAATAFTPPPGAERRTEDAVDIAAAANQFAPVRPPATLAGLQRRTGPDLGAVGEYGRGVTLLVAIPLWDDAANRLRDQLSTTPGARIRPGGTGLTIGPVSLLLTDGGPSWFLSGTVTGRTLRVAGAQLAGVSSPR
ncbi:MAG: hypothetical protein ACR2KL_08400 [Nocardioidaceae bacterium]